MNQNRSSKKEDAVAPVVGVMLMLVVTIIIAALVATFATGFVGSQSTSPVMVLKGTYSQTNGMTITHAGGDPIALTEIEFMTTPSELFGADADKFAWTIDKSIITVDGINPMFNPTTGFYTTSSFVSGDTLYIAHSNCIDIIPNGVTAGLPDPGVNQNAQLKWSGSAEKNAYFGAYTFGNPANVGKYFYLDMTDASGNVIAEAKVTITG